MSSQAVYNHCTDCDSCGEIALVTHHDGGGKTCWSCDTFGPPEDQTPEETGDEGFQVGRGLAADYFASPCPSLLAEVTCEARRQGWNSYLRTNIINPGEGFPGQAGRDAKAARRLLIRR